MWNVTPTDLHDWSALKAKVAKFGVRNSLLLAPMPTASTAQILGNNEGIEAYTSNIYTRRVLSGEFQVSCLVLTSSLYCLSGHGVMDSGRLVVLTRLCSIPSHPNVFSPLGHRVEVEPCHLWF